MVCRPVVVDSRHFDEGQDPPHHSGSWTRIRIRIKVKSRIRVRVRIKSKIGIRIRIRIRIKVIRNTALYCGALYGGVSLA
jgi:hypothetical protein